MRRTLAVSLIALILAGTSGCFYEVRGGHRYRRWGWHRRARPVVVVVP
jgi:hypothetical protein